MIDRNSRKDPDTLSEVNRLMAQGNEWLNEDENDRAIDCFSRVIELKPDHAPAYAYRGFAYQQKSDIGQAKKNYDRALQLAPDYGFAYYCRGWAKHVEGNYQGELDDAYRGLELDTDPLPYYRRIGAAYHGLQQYDKALEYYNRILASVPDECGTIYNRGLLYADMKQLDLALADFDRALVLSPGWQWAERERDRVLRQINGRGLVKSRYGFNFFFGGALVVILVGLALALAKGYFRSSQNTNPVPASGQNEQPK